MTGRCGLCEKHLKSETIATKTRKIGDALVIVEQREALVCPEHGVVVLDPVAPVKIVPYINPQPAVPYRPYAQPNTISPKTWPTVTYGGNDATSAITPPQIASLS